MKTKVELQNTYTESVILRTYSFFILLLIPCIIAQSDLTCNEDMIVKKCVQKNPAKLQFQSDFDYNSFERVLNSFYTVGYFLDKNLALNTSLVDEYAQQFNYILNTNPKAIVYNSRQFQRKKFRFHPKKNANKFSSYLLLSLEKILNKQIWLCQSILLAQKSSFKSDKNYWMDKRFTYTASGNHVVGPHSYEQFPHHDISTPNFPSVCGIGFYLQDVSSISMGPLEIWPATQHLLGSYANRKLRDTRSSNQKETGDRGVDGRLGHIVDFYKDLISFIPSKIFLAQRGTVLLRDFRTLHRGRELIIADYNRTMVELFVYKT